MSKKAVRLGIELIHEISGTMLEMMDEEEMEELEKEELEADELYNFKPIDGELCPSISTNDIDELDIPKPISIKGTLWPIPEIAGKDERVSVGDYIKAKWTNK